MAKKMTAVITAKGRERTISVWVDNTTAELLENHCDEPFRRTYIIDEYKAHLIERRETRRHQSLSNGFDVIDERSDIENLYEMSRMRDAAVILTDRQREVLYSHLLEKKSFQEIGNEMGAAKQTIYEIYAAAIKKLKKYLK